ncbi:hypothetical protein [Chryseobacterium sp.]|uniref:hypothetical protein n=1 Tax=Chryseobacterium sp. TaxID=1871047 RepID=UPI000EDBF901|nr:hypothetical protein [Chryseobacterium sp.]HCM34119.1 hypothetical protein [Chryseobacterium sp.]
MIRFIDLTGQIYQDDEEKSFAFFDTVRDQFCEFSGCQRWDTVGEFKDDYIGDDINRFLNLIPSSFKNYEWKDIKVSIEGREIDYKPIE